MVKVLFVCLGNICRSPTAEGVLRKFVADEGLSGQIEVQSAGTSSYHQGESAHPISIETAAKRGYTLDSLSQAFRYEHFEQFDWIITMDQSNFRNVMAQAQNKSDEKKVIPFSHLCIENSITHVPDPYYEGDNGFEIVLDIVEDGCRGLISRIKDQINS